MVNGKNKRRRNKRNKFTSTMKSSKKQVFLTKEQKSLLSNLGQVKFDNFTSLYSKLKSDENLNPRFKSDYLHTKRLNKWFVKEFQFHESQWDLEQMISDINYKELVDRINDVYSRLNHSRCL